MDIWIPVIVAILTSFSSYIAAVRKGKGELRKLEARHEKDLEKIEKEHRYNLEKMEAEIAGQAKLYEETKQTDLAGNFIEKLLDKPEISNMIMQEAFGRNGKRGK
ncbi:hypothetical protein [Sporosarcina ureae]|uniref:hypothetical protein n=1 Tax=Sporosarcina ureae TaxID=1571 RepID=UPI0026F0C52B|nr:hypothetical protein [Sporosarcina ureae]